ncbi:MAG TPA: hypothetical protein VNQ56_14145 [Pseudolabrys sp.]|nr:hypothetical protein [Pseudolabrys sp.]
MTARSKLSASTAEEIEAIETLMADLEKRLRRLNATAKKEVSEGASEIQDFVSEALAGITARIRDGASNASEKVVDEASRIGSDAVKRLSAEVDQRPMLMLAIAAGVGFLLGLSRR